MNKKQQNSIIFLVSATLLLLVFISAAAAERNFEQDYEQELLSTKAHRSLERENTHKSKSTFMGWEENKALIDILKHKKDLEIDAFLTPEKSNCGFFYWTVYCNTYAHLFAFACATGNAQIAHRSLEQGADINKTSMLLNGISSTPLHLLITAPYRFNQPKNRLDLMLFLLENGASIHYIGNGGERIISLLSLLAYEDLALMPDAKKGIITFMQKKYGSRQFLIKYLADIQIDRNKETYFSVSRRKITADLISKKVFKKTDIKELLRSEGHTDHMPADIVDIFTQYGERNRLLEEHIPTDDIVDIIIIYLGNSIYEKEHKTPVLPLPIKAETTPMKKSDARCCTIS